MFVARGGAAAAHLGIVQPRNAKAFRSSVSPDAPNEKQGAPLTVHCTSPTSLPFSVMVSVEAMVPPISMAPEFPAQRERGE